MFKRIAAGLAAVAASLGIMAGTAQATAFVFTMPPYSTYNWSGKCTITSVNGRHVYASSWKDVTPGYGGLVEVFNELQRSKGQAQDHLFSAVGYNLNVVYTYSGNWQACFT